MASLVSARFLQSNIMILYIKITNSFLYIIHFHLFPEQDDNHYADHKVSHKDLLQVYNLSLLLFDFIVWLLFHLLNKHLLQTKPMGENTITNIMKVSVAGTSQWEKSLRIIEQEKQQSGSWRKQRLWVQNISPMSQATEV